jgi:glyoxylase-like metal-dependent hydrolase (beta-lactamase superfamily II)
VLVDSGAPERADALKSHLAAEFDGAPVRVAFNTHWHLPHTGGNDWLGETGTRIVAHEHTRLWMSTEYYVEWEKTNYEPRAAAALPTATFRSSDAQPLVLEHGGQRIEYGHLAEAHTDGDIYVRFPGENVIVVGDVLAAGAWPVPDYSTGGWIGGLQDSTRLLLELSDAETRIVAGEGPAQRRPALEAQAEMLDTMHERIRVRMIAAKSIDEIVADNVGEGYEVLGDTRRFVTNVYQGLWWGGRLRGAY